MAEEAGQAGAKSTTQTQGRGNLPVAISIATSLLSAGGGALLEIAPPEATDVIFATGIATFILIISYLLIWYMRSTKGNDIAWKFFGTIFALLFITSAVVYYRNFTHYTFLYPPAPTTDSVIRYVRGSSLTPEAMDTMKAHPSLSAAQLLDVFGEAHITSVWTEESVTSVRILLMWNYVALVALIGLAVFCLIEFRANNEISGSNNRDGPDPE